MVISGDGGLAKTEDGDLLWVRDGQGTKQEAVYDAEKGGVNGHAQSKRDDTDDGKAGILCQRADGELDVSPEIGHGGSGSLQQSAQ
jgi:hypothetical protein